MIRRSAVKILLSWVRLPRILPLLLETTVLNRYCLRCARL